MASVEDYVIDFSKEESGGSIRLPKGKYRVKITTAKAIKSQEKKTPGLELGLTFLEGKAKGKKMRETLWATPKAYSRFRLLLEAVGKKPPKQVKLGPIARSVKGEELVVELDDEEREGYSTRSRVTFEGFFSEEDFDDDLDGDDEEDEDEELEDADEDEDEEDDEDEEEDEPAPKKRRKKAPAKKRSRKAADEEDEDDDELDLDDL